MALNIILYYCPLFISVFAKFKKINLLNLFEQFEPKLLSAAGFFFLFIKICETIKL
jgi:hypothetical protein